MKEDIVKFLDDVLIGACLHSFGVKEQFIEVEFSNKLHEEIKFFIDCRVLSSNARHLDLFSLIEEESDQKTEEIIDIIYFIFFNLKIIESYDWNSKLGVLKLNFEGGDSITLDYFCDEDLSLSLTAKVKKSNDLYSSISFEREEFLG